MKPEMLLIQQELNTKRVPMLLTFINQFRVHGNPHLAGLELFQGQGILSILYHLSDLKLSKTQSTSMMMWVTMVQIA